LAIRTINSRNSYLIRALLGFPSCLSSCYNSTFAAIKRRSSVEVESVGPMNPHFLAKEVNSLRQVLGKELVHATIR